jgi:hypothetical protein
MIGISSIGVVIALAGLAIALLALFAKLWARPKPAEKWEKAEIMKQLLALSERENSLAATAPSARLRAPASRQAIRSSKAPLKAPLKTTAKTSLPIRSKTR